MIGYLLLIGFLFCGCVAADALLRKYMEDSRAVWEGHADALPQVQVGSVIGTHGGPGAVVAAFFRKGSRA